MVEHGGNVATRFRQIQALAVSGLDCFGPRLNYAVGTSHSAPIVSQFAARLFDLIPSVTPYLIKALALGRPRGLCAELHCCNICRRPY